MGDLGRDARIGFIGAGMVGTTLAMTLRARGYRVVAAGSRTPRSAERLAARVDGCTACATPQEAADACDVAFLTTPDDAIARVASQLRWRPGQGVVHCSGAASLDALEGARRQGAVVGALHPLQVFSSVEKALAALPGSTFAVEACGEMRSYLAEVAGSLGGKPIFLRAEDKALYHMSLVMVGGLLAGVAGVAADVWKRFGLDRAEALESLLTLIQGNVDTMRAVGLPMAVAGPYARGDVGTVRKHLAALEREAPEVLPLYCQMALSGLPYAEEKGQVGPERAAEMRRLLEAALVRSGTREEDSSSPEGSSE